MNETLDDLWHECRTLGHLDPAYIAKQLHLLPDAPVVDRVAYILEACAGWRVLNLGAASGTLHAQIAQVANGIYGVDDEPGVNTWLQCDMDAEPERVYAAAQDLGIEVIVAGEILEHLSNPGHCLDIMRLFRCPLIATVPNAFTSIGRQWLAKGYENTHKDHVAWHSPHTLKVLLGRAGFVVDKWRWYNGLPGTAEGIIALAR